MDVKNELRRIVRSRALWLAAGFIFVASVPQIFPTPLWNFQKCHMRLSDPNTIGYLQAVGGAGGIMAAMGYAVVYRWFFL